MPVAVPSLPPSWLEDDLPIQLDISLSRSLPPSLHSYPSSPLSLSLSLSLPPDTNTYTIASKNVGIVGGSRTRTHALAFIRVPSTFLRSSREDVRSNLTTAQLMPSPTTNCSAAVANSPDSFGWRSARTSLRDILETLSREIFHLGKWKSPLCNFRLFKSV